MRLPRPVLLLVLAVCARGADPTPAPSDSIATAKADLAAIRSPLSQPDASAALPTLDMKDVGTMPGPARPDMGALLAPESELGPDGLKKKKEGTGNWLVDAMDKDAVDKKSDHSAAARGREKDDILKGDPDLVRDDHESVRLGRDGLPIDESRDKAAAGEPAAPSYNPLDSFMSGWISAKDHDLLLPASKGDGLSSEVAKSRSDSLQTLELGPSASSSDGMLPAIDASSLSDSKQAPNPYVAELELTPAAQVTAFAAPEIAAFAPADTPEVPRAATVNGMDSGPSDPSHSFIPDFAQPSDDDKYYRQMKRF